MKINRNRAADKLLDLLYPPRCPICHDIIRPGFKSICPECLEKLPVLDERRCEKCGKPVKQKGDWCADCQKTEHLFEKGISVFIYNEVMRQSIAFFKYYGRREYGSFYAEYAWRTVGSEMKKWAPEVIIPVPVHRNRKKKRGYNQAEIIAKGLSERMGIPIAAKAVIRKEKTKAQKELSPKERKDNLKRAFIAGEDIRPWKRVLLVDDIYTTGSTVDAVGRVLKNCGTEEIYVVSICIGKGFVV